MKTFFLRTGLIILSISLSTGCDRSGNDNTTDKNTTTNIPVVELRAGIIPVAECAILNNAPVFRRHGIVVKLTKAASGTQISDGVIGGGLEFGFSNLVTPIIAESRQIQLRIIGPISVEDESRARHRLLVRRDGTITKPQDLKGKVIALNALQNIDHLMLLRWLQENGVNPADVRFQTTPFPNMVASLGNKASDAAAAVEPFVTLASSQTNKFTSLGNYYSSKSGKPTAVSGFVAREDWLKKNREVAGRLITALIEASEEAGKNPHAFRAHVVSMTGTDATVVEKMPLPWYQASGYEVAVSELAETAAKQKFIERTVDPKALIYTQGN
jgi:NitT/TauT family transport system substrate-binding protein